MTRAAAKNPLKHLRVSDARGIAQLATQATAGAAHIAEGVHQSVWSTLGMPGGKEAGQTRGITGLVYRTVHGITQLMGKGADTVLVRLQPLLELVESSQPETPEREAVLAALNGVMGDHLAASGNPLATRMTLRYQGKALDWKAMAHVPAATGKVLMLVHGLCMNDLQWQTYTKTPDADTETGVGTTFDHGAQLAALLGYTPIYPRYNTGLHTSQNGRELSRQLEQLAAHWPAPLEEIAVVAHSMGGLVIRSACHYARQQGMQWPKRLKSIVFLGTPHHGAPLERAGNWLDAVLGSTMYSAPFARLTQLRSAGITDLRYGHVLDEDWRGHDRHRRKPDRRRPAPLPDGVACYAVAASTASRRGALAERLIGDGLVPLHSALGRHHDPALSLAFAKSSQWIGYRMNHMELLRSPEVAQKLANWLA